MMINQAIEQCDKCRFYKALPQARTNGDTGNCLRFPPQISIGIFHAGCFFPTMKKDEWCGEFSPANTPTSPPPPT